MNHALDSAAGQQTLERARLGNTDAPEYTADEQAARANRYEIEMQKLESVAPVILIGQVMDALENADGYKRVFNVIFHDAVKRRDEALVGKLLLRAIELHRHYQVEKGLGA